MVDRFNNIGNQGWNFMCDQLLSDRFTKAVEGAKKIQDDYLRTKEQQKTFMKSMKSIRENVKKEIVHDDFKKVSPKR